ncbi:X-Pro dipeptidyl-peptidase C-terminal non-catalytic domain-containing protein [Aspergillus costaricaensis CBS 115574]|uniref:X-Pro dipeptidyl-peptidase C-terminal non-catalytic domain-containing protein n=1 Tax=Aspergillus costaricaensis CBS 115574 TaxID=1448317 RepID=A0ACD1IBA9_9EURO|nr:X-Pro dipeptidyl-peptidase C-terminal non-catalytic domain-containing protein [Aspergillus costaricaensis CBS 115574]RAK87284.1 X-Pro dipeptidyl-peptidase C-terminal non-catalytic domain-containing protein [Aspergillus costaricaensis CBS 115574]
MPPPVQVAYKRIKAPKEGENGYVRPRKGKSEVLPAGWNGFNAKPIQSDIRIDHDVEIVVRDGARLYVDIYRPAGSAEKIPAVLSWSFYGKKYSALDMLPMCVWNCCVPRSDLSGLEKFEGLDPATWCPRGYAIVSVDTRGAGNSDGLITVMGSQDAEDGYDVVEAIAKMDWCNGCIGMAGNSALAISQWFIASQQPPSLKAIAPWEGSGDIYREQFCRGGWFSMSNFDLITNEIVRGPANSGIEDFEEMYRRSPVSSPFWEDKRADMTKVLCPVYIRGSDVSSIHTMGSVRAWLELPHDKKWIRWGSKQEWYELYSCPESMDELFDFFDRYLKGVENDWEKTPKVRWSALQFGDREAIDDIVLEDFPSPTTEYREFFLSSEKLHPTLIGPYEKISYDSELTSSFAEFSYTFDKPARLIGLPKAVLYMSCEDRDDFTVFVILRKKDKNGKALMHLNFPFHATPVKSIDEISEKEQSSTNLHLGSNGILRASHRAIDADKSIHPQFPFHPHTRQEKVRPGEIVRLEIGIWAMGVDFDAGETISVRVSGQYPSIAEYKTWSQPRPEEELNGGKHFIHCGGEYPSSVILPFI